MSLKRTRLALAIALCSGLVGCGSRLSHERLLADARGGAEMASPVVAGTPAAGAQVESPVESPVGSDVAAPTMAASAPQAAVPSASTASGRPALPSGQMPPGSPHATTAPVGAPSRGVSPRGSQPTSSAATSEPGRPAPGAPARSPGAGAQTCPSAHSTIPIGSVGQLSGPAGAVIAPGVNAVKTWVAWINATKGGVSCHPLRYITADDGGDPSRNQALVKKLVEQDHVIAFVYDAAGLTWQASRAYIAERRIPVVGHSVSELPYTDAMYFPQAIAGGVGLEASAAAVATQAKGQTRLGIVSCVEAPACSRVHDLAPDWASKYGLELVYRAQASLAQPDFTAVCQRAKDAGTEIFYVALDANSVKRVARSCDSVGLHPVYTTMAPNLQPALISDPLLDGAVFGEFTVPSYLVSNPAVDEYQKVLKRYAPGLAMGPGSLLGWVAAKLFEAVTTTLPADPTSTDILDGLYGLRNQDLGGLTYPLTFTRDQPSPRTLCYWVTQIRQRQAVSPNGGKMLCS